MRSSFVSIERLPEADPHQQREPRTRKRIHSFHQQSIQTKSGILQERRSKVLPESSRHYRKLMDSLRSNRNNHQDISNNATTDTK